MQSDDEVSAPAAQGQSHGATADEWGWFRRLSEPDLLPVVVDPTAEIHPDSQISEVGKVPSRYRDGKVVGYPGWPRVQATKAQVDAWARMGDYGIAFQTKRFLAIDIDIDDQAEADAVQDTTEAALGNLQWRTRAGSPRRLALIEVEGGSPQKSTLKTRHGVIEYLGNGQQCIVAGLHVKSRIRYTWAGGLPTPPKVTLEQLDALKALLQMEHGLPGGDSTSKPALKVGSRSAADIADPDVAWLEAKGWVTDWAADGRVDVRCPWAAEHTSDTGTSSTSYYPAGVGGERLAGFKCLHAHCASRGIFDFRRAIGLEQERILAEFPMVEAEPDEHGPLPPFVRDKTGRVLAERNNLFSALMRSDVCGLRIAHDTFLGSVTVAQPGTKHWRPMRDTDYTAMCRRLEGEGICFKPISTELVRELVRYVAETNKFDSAQTWLNSLQWDGVERVATFLIDHLNADDAPYVRAVGAYMWTGLAGRVLDPGIKADMVPVLVGGQGKGKSSITAAIAPDPQLFGELDLGRKDADQTREMRGKLVIELGELRGLRVKEREVLKGFITRRVDELRPLYSEFMVPHPRRCLFIGTTNTKEFLDDDTGHRRWLPVEVLGHADLDARIAAVGAVERDRDQLWAEAAVMFRKSGIAWRDAEQLAPTEHIKFEVVEPWAQAIERWLAEPEDFDESKTPRGDTPFTVEQVLTGSVNMDLKQITSSHRQRVAKVLRQLGYSDDRRMLQGRRTVWWERVLESVHG